MKNLWMKIQKIKIKKKYPKSFWHKVETFFTLNKSKIKINKVKMIQISARHPDLDSQFVKDFYCENPGRKKINHRKNKLKLKLLWHN